MQVFNLFNLSGRHPTSPAFFRTSCTSLGERFEHGSANRVHGQVHSKTLHEAEDKHSGKFALENILDGELKRRMKRSKLNV